MTTTQLPEIHVGRPKTIGPLTVFPLWTDAPAPSGIRTTTSADLEVTETSPEPEVHNLQLANRGASPVLLLEGDLLEGGWQHRVLVHDVLVGGHSWITVDVACVEAGRWHGGGAHTASSHRAAPSIRAALTGLATEPVQAGGMGPRLRRRADLRVVADLVLHMQQSGGADIPLRYRTLPGQRGVLVGAEGYPLLAELFPSTTELRRRVESLLRSIIFDAARLSAAEPVPGRRARRMEALPVEPRPDHESGEGVPFVGESAELVLRGTQAGDRWAHLTVFHRRHPLLGLAA
jgi:hypothetical protein